MFLGLALFLSGAQKTSSVFCVLVSRGRSHSILGQKPRGPSEMFSMCDFYASTQVFLQRLKLVSIYRKASLAAMLAANTCMETNLHLWFDMHCMVPEKMWKEVIHILSFQFLNRKQLQVCTMSLCAES